MRLQSWDRWPGNTMSVEIDCFVGMALNEAQLEVQRANAPIGQSFLTAVTRAVLYFADLVIDSATAPAGTFDWNAESAQSIIKTKLGLAVTTNGTLIHNYSYKARLELYQGAAAGVVAHSEQLRVVARLKR